MNILKIEYKDGYYTASTPQNQIIIGGPYNLYSVDGTSLEAVMLAAIEYADVIDARLLEVNKVTPK